MGPDGQLSGGRQDVIVYHAGTKATDDGLVTSGGRVLGVTAMGADLHAARAKAYAGVEAIRWPGMHYRKDIGLRGQS